jgi:hypothetical protein
MADTYFVRMVAKEGEAANAHERGDAFREYRRTIGPLVEPDSVVFGNTEPVKILGYGLDGGSRRP